MGEAEPDDYLNIKSLLFDCEKKKHCEVNFPVNKRIMNPEKKKPKKGMWMDMNDAAKKMAIEKDPKNEYQYTRALGMECGRPDRRYALAHAGTPMITPFPQINGANGKSMLNKPVAEVPEFAEIKTNKEGGHTGAGLRSNLFIDASVASLRDMRKDGLRYVFENNFLKTKKEKEEEGILEPEAMRGVMAADIESAAQDERIALEEIKPPAKKKKVKVGGSRK